MRVKQALTDVRDLHKEIAAMEAAGTDRFDPVRFRYIRSLADRAAEKPEPVAGALALKIKDAIDIYQADLDHSRGEALETSGKICSAAPGQERAVNALFANHEFNKILRIGRKIKRSCRRPTGLSELTDLIQRLSPDASEKEAAPGMEDILRLQERDALASASPQIPEKNGQTFPRAGLRSLKRIQQTMVKLHSDRLVTRAIHESPENAGPHNAQMLAASTLAVLHRLAPAYLERFVAHLDTLIWLRQAGEELEKSKAKKPKTK